MTPDSARRDFLIVALCIVAFVAIYLVATAMNPGRAP